MTSLWLSSLSEPQLVGDVTTDKRVSAAARDMLMHMHIRATAALPLTQANDDEAAPFPVDAALGGLVEDPILTTAPLTLYRLLLDGTGDAGNLLRAVKRPALVEIRY